MLLPTSHETQSHICVSVPVRLPLKNLWQQEISPITVLKALSEKDKLITFSLSKRCYDRREPTDVIQRTKPLDYCGGLA